MTSDNEGEGGSMNFAGQLPAPEWMDSSNPKAKLYNFNSLNKVESDRFVNISECDLLVTLLDDVVVPEKAQLDFDGSNNKCSRGKEKKNWVLLQTIPFLSSSTSALKRHIFFPKIIIGGSSSYEDKKGSKFWAIVFQYIPRLKKYKGVTLFKGFDKASYGEYAIYGIANRIKYDGNSWVDSLRNNGQGYGECTQTLVN